MREASLRVWSLRMTIKQITTTIRDTVFPHDMAQVAHLVQATQFFTEAETAIAVELVEERLSKGTASGYEFVIADQGADMVGYACFGEIPCTVGSFDLYWIVVDPACQRAGIGLQLMQEVQQRVITLRGRGIYIDTSGKPQYASTRAFYERCGYRLVADLPDFYAPNDAKQVYWRAVQSQESVS